MSMEIPAMAVGRAQRRAERLPEVVAVFGAEHVSAALDLLELVELAWHDCYGQIAPPDDVVADMLLLSDGRIDKLIEAARLGVMDERDLRAAADRARSSSPTGNG
jgi:hypothetical protein